MFPLLYLLGKAVLCHTCSWCYLVFFFFLHFLRSNISQLKMFGIVFTWLKIFLCIGYVSSSAVFNNSKISWNYLLISLSCVWISYNVYALSYHLVSTNYRMFSNLCWKICLWSYDTPLETFTQIFTVYVIFHIFSITTQQSKHLIITY